MKTLTLAILSTTLLSTPAMAESLQEAAENTAHAVEGAISAEAISELPEAGQVTISGEVTSIDLIDNEFTVQDESGEIDVETSNKVNVNTGDKVTVTGTIKDDLGEKEISGTQITVTEHAKKTDEQADADTVERANSDDTILGIDLDSQAKPQLPASGTVTVSGVVSDLDEIDKEFTVKTSAQGDVDVEMSDELTVNIGDKVTVTGQIQEDLGEREIAARSVQVHAR